jgi:phosphatidylglycerophosphatase A
MRRMPRSSPFLSRAAFVLATGLGSGYSPIAPGTAGSAVGILAWWGLSLLPREAAFALMALVLLLGTAAAHHVARSIGREDPGLVVVDEVVGQWVALLFLPFTPATAVAAFFLFRLMDILKPWPARDFERLHGGIGIMADDLMAGVYANLLLRVALLVWPVA